MTLYTYMDDEEQEEHDKILAKAEAERQQRLDQALRIVAGLPEDTMGNLLLKLLCRE